ncbi:hypothetical protein MHU86_9143 [Fragilaria crotonensis]|nr:hypothetical protein MHU86_9143 [Fragilaria crotonensis]
MAVGDLLVRCWGNTTQRQEYVFIIKKGIVDDIIGDMFYCPPQVLLVGGNAQSMDEDDINIYGDEDEPATDERGDRVVPTFGSCAEHDAVIADRLSSYQEMKRRAMSIFERQEDLFQVENDDSHHCNETSVEVGDGAAQQRQSSYQYIASISNTVVFDLVIGYIMWSFVPDGKNILHHTAVVCGTKDVCHRGDISKMVRVACAANLQKISELLQESWGFSIALDSATHQSTSYLDLRFRLYSKKHRKIYNVHGCALPLHDRHTGEVMFNMLTKFLDVLCPNWKVSMLGVATDGARNMTGRAVGVVTRLQQAMHPKCPMLRIWCGAHQLDLVMEHVMKKVVNESFFSIMLSFITHLSRQQKLVADMGTTCPRVVNRWLSTYKVTNWFKLHRAELLHYIEKSNLNAAPPRIWWVYLVAVDAFTNATAVTFKYIQGSTMLINQQNAAFEARCDTGRGC